MGRLTTHVLDTAHGRPAAGMRLVLYTLGGPAGERHLVCARETNADGRCDAPLLEGTALLTGVYEIEFAAGAYFHRLTPLLPDPPFVGDVILRFGIAHPEQHYHVPLLVSPWSWSTYRGS